MKRRNVALVVFYDGKKRILLQDRIGISKSGEAWGFFGGGIEEGETPEQAAIREMKEELDVVLENYRYLGTCTASSQQSHTKDRHVFIAPLPKQKMTLHEGRAMEFFSIREARTLKMGSSDGMILDMAEKELEKLHD